MKLTSAVRPWLGILAATTLLFAQPELRAEEGLPEQSQIYHPNQSKPKIPGGLPLKEFQVMASDGVALKAWWLPPCPGRPTVLLFHGTFSNLESTEPWLRDLQDLRCGVLAIDYRGYGQSQGSPCETGLYRDARAAYALALRLGVKPTKLLVLGQSLGGAVATQLAMEKSCAGLILESTFSSAPAMGLMLAGPSALTMHTKYDTLSKVKQLKVPLLIIHGESDPLIPVGMGKLIFAAARQPKALWLVPGGGGHGGLNGPGYRARLKSWMSARGL